MGSSLPPSLSRFISTHPHQPLRRQWPGAEIDELLSSPGFNQRQPPPVPVGSWAACWKPEPIAPDGWLPLRAAKARFLLPSAWGLPGRGASAPDRRLQVAEQAEGRPVSECGRQRWLHWGHGNKVRGDRMGFPQRDPVGGPQCPGKHWPVVGPLAGLTYSGPLPRTAATSLQRRGVRLVWVWSGRKGSLALES